MREPYRGTGFYWLQVSSPHLAERVAAGVATRVAPVSTSSCRQRVQESPGRASREATRSFLLRGHWLHPAPRQGTSLSKEEEGMDPSPSHRPWPIFSCYPACKSREQRRLHSHWLTIGHIQSFYLKGTTQFPVSVSFVFSFNVANDYTILIFFSVRRHVNS